MLYNQEFLYSRILKSTRNYLVNQTWSAEIMFDSLRSDNFSDRILACTFNEKLLFKNYFSKIP